MIADLPITDTPSGARFLVRVIPRASRTAVAGILGEGPSAALKIALQAPPLEGRANQALIDFLADLLRIRRADLAIAAGPHSRTRTILVRNRSAAEITSTLHRVLPS